MPRPQFESLCLCLERTRDCKGGSETSWCPDYWQGVVAEEVKIDTQKWTKTAPKTVGFLHLTI